LPLGSRTLSGSVVRQNLNDDVRVEAVPAGHLVSVSQLSYMPDCIKSGGKKRRQSVDVLK
jgi:hypothetical protein